MKGINLRSLARELSYAEAKFETQPVLEIHPDKKLDFCRSYIESRFDVFSFQDDYYKLHLGALRNFSFDELCRIKYSTVIMMDESVCKLFEKQPNHEVVRKIMSSMWRWGAGKGTWNEVVDVWNGIRQFSLGLNPDFEIRLDYTTGYNEFGNSKYSRTFIDGVFAFLVYYKRKHVMTIGFSVTEGRRILIQQVQLKQQSGNRWLYKFPKNRMEFVIDLFAKYFPGFMLCIIDGESLVKKTLSDYQRGLQRAQERIERNRRYVERDFAHCGADIKEDESEAEAFQTRIAHLKIDLPRLSKFYKDCGRHALGQSVVFNHITHYQLELSN
jgi:hypothetical protein